MDESWILLDEQTGLHVSWYFWLRVLDEVNRSARYGHPFGLLLLEVEMKPGAPARAAESACGQVAAAIRSTDLGGLIGVGRAGVVLPHQDLPSAQRASDRIVSRLDASAPAGVRWHARLLSYPGDGAEISNLLTSGWTERRGRGAAAQSSTA
jgi:hypothetical protein